METSQYVVIPFQFVNKKQFQRIGVNLFHARQTLDGRWVTSANALNEFEEFFNEFNIDISKIEIINLSIDDFPKLKESI